MITVTAYDTPRIVKAIELLVKAAKLGEEHARNWCKENGYDY